MANTRNQYVVGQGTRSIARADWERRQRRQRLQHAARINSIHAAAVRAADQAEKETAA